MFSVPFFDVCTTFARVKVNSIELRYWIGRWSFVKFYQKTGEIVFFTIFNKSLGQTLRNIFYVRNFTQGTWTLVHTSTKVFGLPSTLHNIHTYCVLLALLCILAWPQWCIFLEKGPLGGEFSSKAVLHQFFLIYFHWLSNGSSRSWLFKKSLIFFHLKLTVYENDFWYRNLICWYLLQFLKHFVF